MEPSCPALTARQRELVQRGIELFNREQFFECHEVLEEVWLQAGGEQRTFLQGLIQAAVALHHLRRENPVGAGRLLEEAIKKLSAFVPEYEGVALAGLLAALERLLQQLHDATLPPDWKAPRIAAQ